MREAKARVFLDVRALLLDIYCERVTTKGNTPLAP